ncbi:MAG: DUF1801 domain-containing protein [Sneathiella sp.]|nr:DUF1801 domain-containing protein [Sneathiella sp.]
MHEYSIDSLEVAAVYQSFPQPIRQKLLKLRQMIFEIADQTDTIGQISETLKWGVPSYLTSRPKSGTTVRLQWIPGAKRYGIFVHCQTSLIPDFKEKYPRDLKFEKSRGILFEEGDDFPPVIIKEFLTMALTYHAAGKLQKSA